MVLCVDVVICVQPGIPGWLMWRLSRAHRRIYERVFIARLCHVLLNLSTKPVIMQVASLERGELN